ncbi:Gfo/Idh/MocA family protein [Microlunatus soli]|uniref:Predicted dehydrogenase n=1 Tax=Microlunatus soli TaxID=630515 RepID=A0A1H1NVL7_9ACTN|nr:Gfo/Idh/MocA family oxidoreductase [Microlunatus soli]SDS02984.1 Predicted dehydrogenase [Microlunatus soli]
MIAADRPLRVAVVGAGGWGEQHARIFAGRDDCELVAVAGRTVDRTNRRAAAYGSVGYTDLHQMITETTPDLVTVCLPNEDHYRTTRFLIDSGMNLLVEKPLVFDLSEADDLLARAERQQIFFAINFNHRYAEAVQRAKAEIDAGALGDLVFLTWRFGGEANIGRSPHANLIETQCHGFDLLEQLGGPIDTVAAQMADHTYGACSTVALALSFTSGAVGTLLGSYDSSYAFPDSQLIEINGTKGRATIHDTVQRLTVSSHGDETARVWQPGYFGDDARSFRHTFDRYVDALLAALRADGPPPVPAAAGRRALQLATAAIASHERGTRVPVDEFDPA